MSGNLGKLLQRLLTILGGLACMVVGHYLPDQAIILYPAAAALIGWATPHPADAIKDITEAPAPQAGPPLIFAAPDPRERPTPIEVPPKKAA